MLLIDPPTSRHRLWRLLMVLLLAGLAGVAHSQTIIIPEPPSLGIASDRDRIGLSDISERINFDRPFDLALNSDGQLYVPGQTGGQFGDAVLINGLLAGSLGGEKGPLNSQTVIGSLLRNEIVGGLLQGLLGGQAGDPFGEAGLLGRAVNPLTGILIENRLVGGLVNSPLLVVPVGALLDVGLLGVEGPLGFEGTAGRLLSVEDGLLGGGILGGNPLFYNLEGRLAPGVLVGRNGDGTGGLLGYGSLLGTGILAERGLLGTGLLNGNALRGAADRVDLPHPDLSRLPRPEIDFDRSFENGVLEHRLSAELRNLRRR